jgi:hypothetical protein
MRKQSWDWVRCAGWHEMKDWKATCIGLIAMNKVMMERDEYKRARQEWDKRLMFEIAEVSIKHLRAALCLGEYSNRTQANLRRLEQMEQRQERSV